MEFEKLKPGDIVYHQSDKDELWTVVARSLNSANFVLVLGRHELTNRTKRLWLIMAMLPDHLCLELAEYMGFQLGRMIDFTRWQKLPAD